MRIKTTSKPTRPDLKQIEYMASVGFRVFLLDKGEKRPLSEMHLGKALSWQEHERSYPYSFDQIIERVEEDELNAGIAPAGSQIIIDVDRYKDGGKSYRQICDLLGFDPVEVRHPHTLTASGGLHFFYNLPEGVTGDDLHRALKHAGIGHVDIIAPGKHYAVCPGSVLSNGGKYVLIDPDKTLDDGGVDIPSALLKLILRTDETTDEADTAPLAPERRKWLSHATNSKPGAISLEHAAELLTLLPASSFRDQNDWLRVMMAYHDATAGAGLEDFKAWSASDEGYDGNSPKLLARTQAEIAKRWASLGLRQLTNRVTHRTLFHELEKALKEQFVAEGFPEEQAAEQAARRRRYYECVADFDDGFVEDFEASQTAETIQRQEQLKRLNGVQSKPIIRIGSGDGDLTRMTDEAIRALAQPDMNLFRRGDIIVEPVKAVSDGLKTYNLSSVSEKNFGSAEFDRDPTSIVIKPCKTGYLQEVMGLAARWRTPRKLTAEDRKQLGDKADGKTVKYVPSLPPLKIAQQVQLRNSLPGMRVLRGVFNNPTLTPEGEILQTEGYHDVHGVLLNFGGVKYPTLPDFISKEMAREAVDVLLEPLAGYKFASPASKGVALSGMLTSAIQPFLDFSPIHGVDADHAGAGKTKLAIVWSLVGTGSGPAIISQPRTDEELGKRLETSLKEGDPAILIDNCDRPLGGTVLNSITTSTEHTVRQLGVHEALKLSTNQFRATTGNYFQAEGDTTRRSVVCRLEVPPNPERRSFDFEPVMRAKENRPRYIMAALTIIKAYIDAGRPLGNKYVLGSFEMWSNLVQQPIIWLLGEDHRPTLTTETQQATDPQKAPLRDMLSASEEAIGIDTPTHLKAIQLGDDELSNENSQSRERFAVLKASLICLLTLDSWNPRRVGQLLKKHVGVVADGLMLEALAKDENGTPYRLRRVGEER